jgi:hypothetical protein
MVNIIGNEVRQVVILCAFPTLLDRIQLRRVRGKPLKGEPIWMVLCEEGRRRAMHSIAIPNQHHPATMMTMQLPQKPNQMLGLHVLSQELEIMR